MNQVNQMNINSQLNTLIESFNANSVILVNFMSKFVSTLTFKIYKTEFDRLVRINSDFIIDTFTLNVLKYKEHIMSDNDDFFLGYNDFDSNDAMKVFEFKSIWYNLNEQNKDTIKAYMKLLCEIASVYRDLKMSQY